MRKGPTAITSVHICACVHIIAVYESDRREKEENYLISATILHFPFMSVDIIAPPPRLLSPTRIDGETLTLSDTK